MTFKNVTLSLYERLFFIDVLIYFRFTVYVMLMRVLQLLLERLQKSMQVMWKLVLRAEEENLAVLVLFLVFLW